MKYKGRTIGSYIVTENGIIYDQYQKKELRVINGRVWLRSSEGYKATYYYVKKLVAKLYVPNPNSYRFVRPKDNNDLHLHYTNLEWVKNNFEYQNLSETNRIKPIREIISFPLLPTA